MAAIKAAILTVYLSEKPLLAASLRAATRQFSLCETHASGFSALT